MILPCLYFGVPRSLLLIDLRGIFLWSIDTRSTQLFIGNTIEMNAPHNNTTSRGERTSEEMFNRVLDEAWHFCIRGIDIEVALRATGATHLSPADILEISRTLNTRHVRLRRALGAMSPVNSGPKARAERES